MSKSPTSLMTTFGTSVVGIAGHIVFENGGSTIEVVPRDDFSLSLTVLDPVEFIYNVRAVYGPDLSKRPLAQNGYQNGVGLIAQAGGLDDFAWGLTSRMEQGSLTFIMRSYLGGPPTLNITRVYILMLTRTSSTRY